MVMDVLRWARLDDAAALHSLFFALETGSSFYPRLVRWLEVQERGRMIYLLVERQGQLVGQGQLFLWPGKRGEIANVAVAAAYQSQGIGTTLLTHLLQQAQMYGCTTVEISAAAANQRAQSLYQRLGFSVDHPLYSSYDETGVVMKIPLRSNL